MSQENRLRIKTLFMVLLMVVCANTGDLMLKRGMLQIGAVQVTPIGLWHALLATIHNGTIFWLRATQPTWCWGAWISHMLSPYQDKKS